MNNKGKFMLLLFTVLLMGSLAFAQAGYTSVTNVDDLGGATPGQLLGGHGNGQGCLGCHAPHRVSGGLANTETAGMVHPFRNPASVTNTKTWTATGGVTSAVANVTNWTADSAGGQIAGNFMLWERALPQTVVYTTSMGTTISKADVTGSGSAAGHTLLCMTCHDAAMSSYAMGKTVYPGEVGGTPVYNDGSGNAVFGIGAGGVNGNSLANDHPVHVAYRATDPNGVPKLWKINADGSFVDTDFVLETGVTGHPAKLFVEGGTAYVECASCHNPHRRTSYAYQQGTRWVTGAAGSTESFLRGPFDEADSTLKSNFCRSCHYDKSADYFSSPTSR